MRISSRSWHCVATSTRCRFDRLSDAWNHPEYGPMFDPLIRIDPSISTNSGTFGFGRGGSAPKLGEGSRGTSASRA